MKYYDSMHYIKHMATYSGLSLQKQKENTDSNTSGNRDQK